MDTDTKTEKRNLSEAILLLNEARTRLELGPTSGRASRIWVGEAADCIERCAKVLASVAGLTP